MIFQPIDIQKLYIKPIIYNDTCGGSELIKLDGTGEGHGQWKFVCNCFDKLKLELNSEMIYIAN